MTFGQWILDLLFPTRCIICRDFLNGGKPRICRECAEKLPYTKNGGISHGDFFSLCVSSVYYEKEMRDAILRYKFSGASAYAPAFGELIASTVYQELEEDFDLITWVPLDKRRFRKRGYDQAFLLAKYAGKALCREPVRLLEKQRRIKPQSGMGSPEKRRANIAGAYRVIDPPLVENKKILLIDDIITTGATLSECAKTLLLAGAEDVCCATLARTKERKGS